MKRERVKAKGIAANPKEQQKQLFTQKFSEPAAAWQWV